MRGDSFNLPLLVICAAAIVIGIPIVVIVGTLVSLFGPATTNKKFVNKNFVQA